VIGDINAVVLLSGGIDSSTLLHFVARKVGGKNVHALSFIYGQKHDREVEEAKWQAADAGVAEHRILKIPVFGEITAGGSVLTGTETSVPDLSEIAEKDLDQPPTYVPNRNMTLLSFAAAYAEAANIYEVYYGAQAQDSYGYWDCTKEFVDRINNVLALNHRNPVRIHAPFAGQSKSEVLKTGLEMGVNYRHTWTCYRGGAKPCMTCPSCRERKFAFEKLGIRDPLVAGDA